MTIKLNKNSFVDTLVSPSSKLSDNLLLSFDKTKQKKILKTLTSSSDNSVILLSHCEIEGDCSSKIIIPEVKTFLRLFSNIQDEVIELCINDNQITYEGSEFNFKYHLLDEEYYTNKKSLNEEKLQAIKFNTFFTISKNKFSEILKYHSIIPEAEKLYFYTQDSKIIGQLGDKQKPNINEIVTTLSENYSGDSIEEPIPISVLSLLLLTFSSDTIDISFNKELRIIKLSSKQLTYILSGLVK